MVAAVTLKPWQATYQCHLLGARCAVVAAALSALQRGVQAVLCAVRVPPPCCACRCSGLRRQMTLQPRRPLGAASIVVNRSDVTQIAVRQHCVTPSLATTAPLGPTSRALRATTCTCSWVHVPVQRSAVHVLYSTGNRSTSEARVDLLIGFLLYNAVSGVQLYTCTVTGVVRRGRV